MSEKSEKLLQKPQGSFQSETWWDAQDLIQYWAVQRTPESVDISFRLLDRCVQEQSGDTIDATLFLDRDLVNLLLYNYHHVYKHKTLNIQHPNEVFQKLETWCSQCPSLSISGKGMSLLMDAATKTGDYAKAALFCEMLLIRMVQDNFRPSSTNLNCAINAWAKSGVPNVTNKAEGLLKRMFNAGVELDIVSYNSLMSVYSQQGQAEYAEALLQELVSAWLQDKQTVKPDLITFNSAVNAWSRSNDMNAAERAQDLLRRLLDPSDFGRLGLAPDVYTLNSVLLCWARSQHEDSAERAYAVFQEMKELSDSGELNACPDSFSYGVVLNAFAKSGNPGKAEALLSVMYSKYMGGDSHLKPTVQTLTLILESWTRSEVPSRMERAEAVLLRMQELHEEGVLESGPDTTTYNVMLNGYAASNQPDAVDRAKALLERMKTGVDTPQPDFKTYAIMIRQHLQRTNGAERASALLKEAYDGYLQGNVSLKPNIHSVNAVIKGLGSQGKTAQAEALLKVVCDDFEHGRSTVKPDVISFGSMVAALSNSDEADAASRADVIVSHMITLHEAGLLDEGPDYLIYRALIQCWAKSRLPGSGKKAVSLLRKLRRRARNGESDMEPDTISYNQVLLSLARARRPGEAEMLLRQMFDDYQKSHRRAKPNTNSFNNVLSAWSRFKSAPYAVERAQSLLEHMQLLYESNALDVKPDRTSFNLLILCLARSPQSASAEQAEAILRFMQAEATKGDEKLQPDARTYGNVIKAWINRAEDASKAEEILMEMCDEYKAGRNACRPEKNHFELVFEAFSKRGDRASMERVQDVYRSLTHRSLTNVHKD